MKTFALGRMLACVALLVGCAAENATDQDEEDFESTGAAIVNGTRDTAHPSVVAIEWTIESKDGTKNTSLCTGTVIAARTVLTAGHCAKPADPTQRFTNYRVYFGDDATAKDATWQAASIAVAHPKYNPKVFGSYDIAVVLLQADAPVKPMRIARSLGNLVGTPITHVGFGTTISTDRNTKSGIGKKYTVTLPVTAQTATTLATGDGKSGICNGDSGGPAFAVSAVSKELVVVGVHSYIDDTDKCLKNGFSARTDLSYDFIRRFQ